MRRTIVFTLLPLTLIFAPIDRACAEQYCNTCDNTGGVENKAWKRIEKEVAAFGLQDEPLLHVSFHIDQDKSGSSLEQLPCGRCKAPETTKAAQAELERRAAEKTAWLLDRRKIDKMARPRGPLAHVETEHFRLTCGLRKVTLRDKRVLNTEQAALMYARRLEDYYDWFLASLDYTDEDARVTKHDVFLMGDLRTLMAVGQEFCNLPTDRSARAVGDPSVMVTWPENGVFPRDEDFHRHVLYHVSHLLLGVYYMKVWLVEHAGWLEEGLAHKTEMDLFTMAGNTSNQEQSEPDRNDADWEPEVRELIVKGRLVPFAELIRKRADQLNGVEHKLAWSYTDFLYQRGGKEKLALMIQELKRSGDLEQVRVGLKTHYDLTVNTIEEEWRVWVMENYRVKS